MDADPHHGEANHGTPHSEPKEMVQPHPQSKSWNYDLYKKKDHRAGTQADLNN